MKELPVTSPDMCAARDLSHEEAQQAHDSAVSQLPEAGRGWRFREYGDRPAVTLHGISPAGTHWWYDAALKTWCRQ